MKTNFLIKIKKDIMRFNRNKKIKDYYLKKMKNGKSYNAVIIDSLLIKVVFAIISLLIINKLSNNFLISILLSLLIFISLVILSYHIKKQQFISGVEEINNDLGKKRIIKEITFYTNNEFVEYVKSILECYYSTTFVQLDNSDIDLIGRVNEESYGIKCIKLPQDERVTKKEVRSFEYSLNKSNLEFGILLTNSYFVDELRNQEIIDIELMDLDYLLSIIKKVNKYPTNKEIEEHILNRYTENKRKLLSSREKVFTSHKIKTYLILSISLFLLSKIATYSSYYLIMAVITLLLGLISFIFTIYNILNMKMKD